MTTPAWTAAVFCSPPPICSMFEITSSALTRSPQSCRLLHYHWSTPNLSQAPTSSWIGLCRTDAFLAVLLHMSRTDRCAFNSRRATATHEPICMRWTTLNSSLKTRFWAPLRRRASCSRVKRPSDKTPERRAHVATAFNQQQQQQSTESASESNARGLVLRELRGWDCTRRTCAALTAARCCWCPVKFAVTGAKCTRMFLALRQMWRRCVLRARARVGAHSPVNANAP